MCRTIWNQAGPQQQWVAALWGPWQLQCTVINRVALSWGAEHPHSDDRALPVCWILFPCFSYVTFSLQNNPPWRWCYSGFTDEDSKVQVVQRLAWACNCTRFDLRSVPKPGIAALCPRVTWISRICGIDTVRQGKNSHMLYISNAFHQRRSWRVKELMAIRCMARPINFPPWLNFFSVVLVQFCPHFYLLVLLSVSILLLFHFSFPLISTLPSKP